MRRKVWRVLVALVAAGAVGAGGAAPASAITQQQASDVAHYAAYVRCIYSIRGCSSAWVVGPSRWLSTPQVNWGDYGWTATLAYFVGNGTYCTERINVWGVSSVEGTSYAPAQGQTQLCPEKFPK